MEQPRPITSLLIANRGEIACRVARTARAMGIRTIAVYSDADADAPHVRACDEAWAIGPAPAAESYLVVERILDVAKRSGADAVHPGYGFLSENAGFAEACEAAGVIFVGPPASAIKAMGSKAGAKALMEKAGVPLVPGYHGDDQAEETLARAALEIGFPVLLKASAGGGGKGMRVVRSESELSAALGAAKREGKASFGDDRLIVEKYLEKPRHVEVQVFADRDGNTVHLFERDCSAQRRHQKVLEEAPAPGLDAETRARIGQAAVDAAKAVGYVGAGTVEFIMDEAGSFHFMEMNTRLQVEHPVTELITGLDLVALQIRVAAGEGLPVSQDALAIDGHAVEVRLYAEDPARDFLPQTGRLKHLHLPSDLSGIRIDSGVEQGGTVSVHYDPMIAKIIAHGPDRATAFARLAQALGRTRVVGVVTNAGFLKRLCEHPEVLAGGFDTGFIARAIDQLAPTAETPPDAILAAAAVAEQQAEAERARQRAATTGDPSSPWARADGWRMNGRAERALVFLSGEASFDLTISSRPDRHDVTIGDRVLVVTGAGSNLVIDGRALHVVVIPDGDTRSVFADGRSWALTLVDPMAGTSDVEDVAGALTAPMPAKVTAVHVETGAEVTRGQPLVVLEAMKMEHTISAPADGTVTEVRVATGDLVDEAAVLVSFEPTDDGKSAS
jgi:3-methylcrotonyl-CoA carboxylase alpha subunit